jgi:hypothetical protein
MDKIQVVPYAPEHLARMKIRDDSKTHPIKSVSLPAITLTHKGIPIAVFGWMHPDPGMMHVWSLITDDIRFVAFQFHKEVLRLIAHAFERFKLRRMQMSVRAGYHEGWSWACSLGFVCEGTMQRYGIDGTDYWLFARTV